MTWELNDDDVIVSEPEPQGCPSHTPAPYTKDSKHRSWLNERQARDCRSTVAVTKGLAAPGHQMRVRYLSERAQLHDYPDGVLRDDANQLHNVRVVELPHRH